MLPDVECPVVFGNSGVGVAGCHDVVLENGRKRSCYAWRVGRGLFASEHVAVQVKPPRCVVIRPCAVPGGEASVWVEAAVALEETRRP